RGVASGKKAGAESRGKTLYLATDLGREFVNLARVDVATGELKFLQDEKHDIAYAVLSPDGHWLAFTTNPHGYEEMSIRDTQTNETVSQGRHICVSSRHSARR